MYDIVLYVLNVYSIFNGEK